MPCSEILGMLSGGSTVLAAETQLFHFTTFLLLVPLKYDTQWSECEFSCFFCISILHFWPVHLCPYTSVHGGHLYYSFSRGCTFFSVMAYFFALYCPISFIFVVNCCNTRVCDQCCHSCLLSSCKLLCGALSDRLLVSSTFWFVLSRGALSCCVIIPHHFTLCLSIFLSFSCILRPFTVPGLCTFFIVAFCTDLS